jgi:hypothetical protein
VSRRPPAWFRSLLAALLLLSLGAPRPASAATNDEEVEALIQNALENEYANANITAALEQIELAKQACEAKKACSSKVRAKVYMAIGTVLAGGQKKVAEAKEAFVIALKEDPTASLYGDHITPEVQRAFNDARGVATASGGSVETVKAGATRQPKKVYSGQRPPRGWKSGEAYFYYREAVASEQNRDWLDCVDYGQASLAAESRLDTRMLSAGCAEKAGLWIEALADFKLVAETAGGPRVRRFDLATKARKKMQELREKIPKIILRKPAKAEGLVVKMNDAAIPPEKVGGEIWVNPGQRIIEATGKVEGVELEFEQVVDVAEFETVTVDIRLAPKGAKDRAVMKCILEAKTRDDFAKCVGAGTSMTAGLNKRLGLEVSGYHSSDSVDVLTPAISFGIESPTSGWGVNAAFLVDIVTAASPDIISTASPRWTEERYVPSLGGHKKFGDVDVSLRGSMSIEPDYLAVGVGAGVAVDLAQKTITPSLNYDFGYDLSGRAGTPYDVFSRTITRHGIDAGATFVLDKATFLATSLTAVFESGDSSKPYRYMPMFTPAVTPFVPVGLSVEGVNGARLPERVLDQLPTSRQRWAIAGRIAHRFTSSTIRVEERLYIDNWGLKATTTDARFLYDVTERLRLWPHLRFHAQTGTSFWKLAYSAEYDPALNALRVPALRTGDRELGPMFSLTGGAGGRFAFGEKKDVGLVLAADVIYTQFLDHLFILQRIGYFGAAALEVEWE